MIEVEGFAGRVFEDPDLQEMVAEMRHPILQKSSRHFRGHAEIIGRELARALKIREGFYKPEEGKLERAGATATYVRSDDSPLILAILRGALPMVNGTLEVFGEAPVAFVDAKRIEGTYDTITGHIDVKINYAAFPEGITSLEGRRLIVPDIMLATGRSLVGTCQAVFEKYGSPDQIIATAAIAAMPGLHHVVDSFAEHPIDVRIYAAQIDPHLDANGYIVPGLGDAGDLCYNGGRRLIDLVDN